MSGGTPSGVTVARSHGKADVAVRGPAASLLLVLTRRLPPADPRIWRKDVKGVNMDVVGSYICLRYDTIWLDR